MKIQSRKVAFRHSHPEEDGSEPYGVATFQVPEGAIQVQAAINQDGSLGITWLELTNSEKVAMARQRGGGIIQ